MVINSNTTAIKTNNYLQRSENRLSQSMQRLSSGNKINNASDNPAGYAISSRMRAQLRSLEKATNNASEGIDFIQTAEGALTEVHDMIQRMNELAVKASNGTLSASDRQAIQDEIGQLCDEIDRLANETEFNGQKMLNGFYEQRGYTDQPQVKVLGYSDETEDGKLDLSFSVETELIERDVDVIQSNGTVRKDKVKYEVVKKIDVNAASGDDYSVRFANKFKTSQSSITYDHENFIISMKAADGTELNLQIEPSHQNGSDFLPDGNLYKHSDSDYDVFFDNGVDVNLIQKGVDILKKYAARDKTEYAYENEYTYEYSDGSTSDFLDTNKQLTKMTRVENTTETKQQKGQVVSGGVTRNVINETVTKSQITYTTDYEYNSDGSLKNSTVTSTGKTIISGPDMSQTFSNEMIYSMGVDLAGIGTMRVQVGGYQGQVIDMNIPEISLAKLDLATIDVRVPGGAQRAIDRLDNALEYTSAVRSKLGAYQNRMEHTINSLDINVESTTRSFSTITDTDMATEMTEYSTLQILQQAATTMLAQANEFPQQALQLLQ